MSAKVDVRDMAGKGAGSVELDEAIFGIEPNVPVMHQVVTAQLAARRGGNQSTRTRAEVAGGGAKPWRQKGTGRARQGSIRSPQWRGGGVTHAPKPRSHAQKTPKKMVRLALRSALSDRAADGKVVVIDAWSFDQPSTKGAVAALAALGVEGRALLVLGEDDATAWKSFRNLGEQVHPILARELNAYDVLVSDVVVFTRETLPTSDAKVDATPVEAPKGRQDAGAPAAGGEEEGAEGSASDEAQSSGGPEALSETGETDDA